MEEKLFRRENEKVYHLSLQIDSFLTDFICTDRLLLGIFFVPFFFALLSKQHSCSVARICLKIHPWSILLQTLIFFID